MGLVVRIARQVLGTYKKKQRFTDAAAEVPEGPVGSAVGSSAEPAEFVVAWLALDVIAPAVFLNGRLAFGAVEYQEFIFGVNVVLVPCLLIINIEWETSQD